MMCLVVCLRVLLLHVGSNYNYTPHLVSQTKIVTDQLPVTSTVNDIIVYVKQQVHTTATTGISDPNNMSLEDTFTEENVIKWTNDV